MTQVSPAAEPGSTLELEWKLTVLDGSKRVPFNAMGVFVRLLDAAGGTPTTALARGSSHPDGLYSAGVVVPTGGVSGIQIGLHGTTDVYAAVLNNPFALNRPLHLPVLARGAKCPVAASDPAIPFARLYRVGNGLGAGPVFPILGSGSTLRYAPPLNFQSSRWAGQKVLWFVLPSYTGPVLIRGGRLDRPGRIGFDRGNVPSLELRLDSSTVVPGGGRCPTTRATARRTRGSRHRAAMRTRWTARRSAGRSSSAPCAVTDAAGSHDCNKAEAWLLRVPTARRATSRGQAPLRNARNSATDDAPGDG